MGLLAPDHKYSYSQLEQIDQCPYSFYMQRIEKQECLPNAFAQQGTLVHALIDEWAKGEIDAEDLPFAYEIRYPQEVTARFPTFLEAKGYATKAYNLGLQYFQEFDRFQDFEIMETETKFETELEGRPFVGVIDMVMRDKANGDLIILDHKSKSLASFKKEQNTMYRQQYVYSKACCEKYGVWPDRLMFNLFKENGLRMERPFEKDAYDATMKWALQQIEKIENFDLMDYFETCEPGFFCETLCSVRSMCPNSVSEKKKRR